LSLVLWLAEAAIDVVRGLGYWGVLALMALESALVPVPSEVVMPFAGVLVARGDMDFVTAVASGTLGNFLGSLALYYIGATWGRGAALRLASMLPRGEEHLLWAEDLFRRRGALIVLAGRMLPAVRTVISLPAGVARMPLRPFAVCTLVGSVPWNAALVYAGVLLGENWHVLREYSPYVDLAALAVGLVALAYLLKAGSARSPGSPRRAS